jgi:hypothetical protein
MEHWTTLAALELHRKAWRATWHSKHVLIGFNIVANTDVHVPAINAATSLYQTLSYLLDQCGYMLSSSPNIPPPTRPTWMSLIQNIQLHMSQLEDLWHRFMLNEKIKFENIFSKSQRRSQEAIMHLEVLVQIRTTCRREASRISIKSILELLRPLETTLLTLETAMFGLIRPFPWEDSMG